MRSTYRLYLSSLSPSPGDAGWDAGAGGVGGGAGCGGAGGVGGSH